MAQLLAGGCEALNILQDISTLWAIIHAVVIFLLFFTPNYSFRRTAVFISSVSVVLLAVYAAFTAALQKVLFLIPITYITILGSLRWQALYYESRNRQNILSAQVAGLQNRIAAVQAAEEAIRIERHDLRHKLLTIAAMAEQGKNAEVLDYVRRLEGAVVRTKPEAWCGNFLLDAVFSVCFAQARQQEIPVRANLVIPSDLTVDAADLSTVFANALENAIHACVQLPVEKREIVCTCICQPSLMLEVANPYTGTVLFGRDGRPAAAKQGHGTGTRSIAAFCEKYGAYCTYEAADGWFRLKIAL